jgi:peptidoglycan hydrolase CwlO-like protein
MTTSEENRNTMLSILAAVDELRLKEAALQSDKTRLEDQIKAANDELATCRANIEQCHEDSLALRRQMENLKDVIFARPEVEETIVEDAAHIVTDGSIGQKDNPAKSAWDARAKHLKQVQ